MALAWGGGGGEEGGFLFAMAMFLDVYCWRWGGRSERGLFRYLAAGGRRGGRGYCTCLERGKSWYYNGRREK